MTQSINIYIYILYIYIYIDYIHPSNTEHLGGSQDDLLQAIQLILRAVPLEVLFRRPGHGRRRGAAEAPDVLHLAMENGHRMSWT